jgi:vancomycin permeability regulator SanA
LQLTRGTLAVTYSWVAVASAHPRLESSPITRLRSAALGLLALFTVGGALAAYLAVAGLTARPSQADVAIVFGNTVDAQGHPSPRLAARLSAARDLYRTGLVRGVIVSGGTGKEGVDEATAMEVFLVQAGLLSEALAIDSRGVTTEATCRNAPLLMQARGWRTADVVTQYFHIVRARSACREAGVAVVGAVAPRFYEARDVYSLFREVVAVPVYLARSWRP